MIIIIVLCYKFYEIVDVYTFNMSYPANNDPDPCNTKPVNEWLLVNPTLTDNPQ